MVRRALSRDLKTRAVRNNHNFEIHSPAFLFIVQVFAPMAIESSFSCHHLHHSYLNATRMIRSPVNWQTNSRKQKL